MPILLRKLTLLTILCWLCACQEGNRFEGMRSQEESERYQAINDSMQHRTPHALRLIREQMKQAKDSLTYYDYYLMYGKHFLINEHPDSLLPYAYRTLQFAKAQEQQTPRTRGLAAMATSSIASYHYLLRHQADTVIQLYQKAYQLMMESDIQENLPDLSANLADAYVAKSDLPNASKWYRRALFLNDSLELPSKRTLSLYMGLGRIYTMLGDYEQAKNFYEMTDKRFDEMKPNMQSYFLNNYGNYFYFQHDYQQALNTFRRLKAHLENYHAEQNFDMYLCKINMADVFLNLHQTDSASIYVKEAESFFRKYQVNDGIYYAQTIRLGIALQEFNKDKAQRILQEPTPTIQDISLHKIRANYMYHYYAAIGDYQKAYAAMEESLHLNDSTRYEKIHMRSSDILTRLTEDTIRLHHQLAMEQQKLIYAKRSIGGWILVAVLIFIIMGLLLWFNHERKRRLQLRLDMLTLRMANTRQRVSPHFVFNVLNSRMMHTDQQEADQLMKLTKLIRANLDLTRKNIVTLSEELDFVSQYVEIEKQFIGEDFEFSIQAPDREQLEDIKIPSMMVQILTENAILHGLKNKDGKKRLWIQVTKDSEQTRISVNDNGPGFDILRYNSKRTRTGLNIIRTTISIINQENYANKMSFDIRNDNGCHAILTIPHDIHFTHL